MNRILYVRNLPYKTEEALSTEEIYDIFGKYGAIRQIRIGNRPDTRGTAFVVYEDIYDAKNAVDHLSGKRGRGARSCSTSRRRACRSGQVARAEARGARRRSRKRANATFFLS